MTSMDRLTATDASMLHGETLEWHLHVATLLPLDEETMPGRYAFESFRDALAQRFRAIPRFCQRVAQVPFGLDRPVWVDAGGFDAERHIRRAVVAAPGGRDELFELAGALASTKLAHDRPLWECWVLERPEGGLAALLIKNHHALFDGVGGLERMQAMFDLSADGPGAPPKAAEAAGEAAVPDAAELLVRSAVRGLLVQPVETLKVARQLVRQAVPAGRMLFGGHRPTLGLDAPASPFAGRISRERVVAGARLSLPLIMQIRRKADVKVNDVLLAVVGSALRRYLSDRERLPAAPLVANVAVSTRSPHEPPDVGNKYGVMFVTLGSDVEDPVERLESIRAGSVTAKRLAEALAQHRETSVSAVGPPVIVDILARLYRAAGLDAHVPLIGNVGVSNVAGPPARLFVCGAAVENIFVFGPLMLNSVVNFTAVSNNDGMDVGITSSPAVVPDVSELAAQLGPAHNELARAFGLPA
jgi:diacylglycerol O-acyltransferase / wax synthase